MIKTFRGKLADEGQDTIRLSTNKGKIGYKIKKIQIIPTTPGAANYEGICKVFTNEQSSVDGTVDFSNSELLGIVYFIDNSSSAVTSSETIIYDNIKFNQDVYITAKDVSGGSGATNYYLELEQMSLSDNEATVATLKDMRGSN